MLGHRGAGDGSGLVLDHVAVAVRRWEDGWHRFAVVLGGRWRAGGWGPGFSPALLEYAGPTKVELLAPNDDGSGFLSSFLDRHGPGPHHLTFTVEDLSAALTRVQEAGWEPVGVDLADPDWKEAFLRPSEATGVVIQLAQPSVLGATTPAPSNFPTPGRQGRLDHIAHVVASLTDALALFAGVLGGREATVGREDDARWIELEWPGGGRVRLLQPVSPRTPLARWLGPRPGRVHHLAFTSGDTHLAAEEGVARDDGTYELDADVATGTRLRVRPERRGR